MFKDAFGNTIGIGTKVLYSTAKGSGTDYVYGEVVKLYPCKEKRNSSYWPPDRVEIKPLKGSCDSNFEFRSKNPILYASNVVDISKFIVKSC